MNQDDLTQFAQKNIAQGLKASQAVLKCTEAFLQLQLNYIRENVEEQAKFAQQFNANTFAQDLSTLQQSRMQRISNIGKDIWSLTSNVQNDIQKIAEEQQVMQKEMNEKAHFANFYDPAFAQKAFEQFSANTALAFNAFNQFVQGATQTSKKAASASKTKE